MAEEETARTGSLNQLFEAYQFDLRHIAGEQKSRTVRYRLNQWIEFVGNDLVESVNRANAERFRDEMLEDDRSPATIESTLGALVTILRHHDLPIPKLGRKLRRRTPEPNPPTNAELCAVVDSVHVARWPRERCEWAPGLPESWWKAFFFLAIWTGYRLTDLLSLRWEHVQFERQRFGLECSKTMKAKYGTAWRPLTPLVERYLQSLHPKTAGPLFGRNLSARRELRREIKRICEAAGVSYINPQRLRQFSVTMWSRADGKAGEIVHGSIGILDYYLDKEVVLRAHAPRLDVPECFLRGIDLERKDNERERLLAAFDSADPETRRLILNVVERTLK